jgi:acyl transferase domain-containing protein
MTRSYLEEMPSFRGHVLGAGYPACDHIPADDRLYCRQRGAMSYCQTSIRQSSDAMQSDRDAVAVVALACNYPGGCGDPDSLWRFLSEGRSALGQVPAGRWPRDLDAPRRDHGWSGGFLGTPFPHSFDAPFFDISPAEALALDPQQRLLLETGWRALEGAGIAIEPMAGKPIGVFVALSTGDYQNAKLWQPGAADSFTATGVSPAAAAGRLSYSFGFDGPSMSVDTACSSSLVAIHLARQAIRGGECEAALVAGVNALLVPNLFDCLDTMSLLSPDGVCRAFDAGANGYVRAEGCGAIVLKPLGTAMRDGNEILAVIRGSAVNQDGRTGGLTAPSGAAQQKVIARALADAGLTPAEIDYVEAHGTGTPLGDAIELNALAESYAKDRDEKAPLLIGSVKTNIGHLEAGAGMAGVIKTILALRHGTIPGHARFERPTPHLAWDFVAMRVPTESTVWPVTGRPRRAGVSSFGFSGTNGHVILEQAPAFEPGDRMASGAVVLPISARTPLALEESVAALADWLETAPRDLLDVAFTLGVGRTAFPHRRAVVGRDAAELVSLLRGEPFADRADWQSDPALTRLAELGAIWAAGGEVDWGRLYAAAGGRLVAVPGHPFHPQRYWPETMHVAVEPTDPTLPTPDALPVKLDEWRTLLAGHARAVLGEVHSEPLDPHLPLTDQGFTSLLGLELRRALEVTLGQQLPASLLYDYPTLDRMAAFLAGAGPTPRRAPAPRLEPVGHSVTDSDFDFLDTLSPAELADLIEREIDV